MLPTSFWRFTEDKAHELEETGRDFTVTVALAFALETGVLTYLLVEFGDDTAVNLKFPTPPRTRIPVSALHLALFTGACPLGMARVVQHSPGSSSSFRGIAYCEVLECSKNPC